MFLCFNAQLEHAELKSVFRKNNSAKNIITIICLRIKHEQFKHIQNYRLNKNYKHTIVKCCVNQDIAMQV